MNLTAPRRQRLPLGWLGLGAVFVLFGWGLVELFELRFAQGDVYPPYSTLRNDPLGAAAFYEALEGQPGLRVERNLRPLDRLGKPPAVLYGHAPTPPAEQAGRLTVFYLGANAYEWPTGLEKPGVYRLEEILDEGDRVVMTFLPGDTAADRRTARTQPRRGEAHAVGVAQERVGAGAARAGGGPPGGFGGAVEDRLPTHRAQGEDRPEEHPGTGGGAGEVRAGIVDARAAVDRQGQGGDPRARRRAGRRGRGCRGTRWRISGWTRPRRRRRGWHALYECGGKPVIVARPFGTKGGELILASDSYFLSNEALRAEPHAALLAGLVGDARRVIFDESHQGLQENPGLMTLARRYGLQGALAATGLLVGLFIWRNVLSLVPPPVASAEAARGGAVTGRDSAAGFLNLLRRGVSARELAGTCLAQWQRGGGKRAPDPAVVERVRAAEAAAASEKGAEARSPAAAYRAMCAAVKAGR